MYDLLIRDATVYGRGEHLDVAVSEGVIREVAPGIQAAARREIQASSQLVTPGFVDSHMHLDKVLVTGKSESKTLDEAIRNFTEYCRSLPEGSYQEDILTRARQVVRKAVQAGSTTLRTHVNIEASTGLSGIEALNALREELKDHVDILITSLPNFFDGPEAQKKRLELVDYACRNHMIDFIGGAPHSHDNWAEITEQLFELAARHQMPLDLHVDESDAPHVDNFEQVADLTLKYGMEGRVSCGHVTALNAVDDDTAARVIAKAKKADLHIITLPSCNLYLMGRSDRQPIRRGVTRIREFLEAGVNISYASDNIRDPFRPLGNGDMLEEGLLTAQVAQMVVPSDLETIFRMGTMNPARGVGLSGYGTDPGCRADLVILDAPSVPEALLSQCDRVAVIKNGRVVAGNRTCSYSAF